MIVDAQLLFSDEQRVCDGAATELSTNVVDFNVIRDLGAGENLYWHILMIEIPAGTGTTLEFRLVTDDNASLTTPATILSSGAIAKATLVAKYKLTFVLPRSAAWERYVGVNYVGDNTFATTGKVSSWLSMGEQDNKVYADNITITG